MSADDNKGLVRRFYDDVVNAGRLELIDEFLAPGFVDHDAFPGVTPDREGVREFFETVRAAFPDLRFEVDDLIAEGDKVAARVTVHGTHRHDFLGIPPTGKEVSTSLVDVIRFQDGFAVERWGVTDTLAMMEQLGGAPVGAV
jgi:steroid delta-isomerase-like uncharacterized protein